MTASLAGFAFVLANVNQHRELDVDLVIVRDDLATLTAAVIVVFRQTHDLGSSGWVLLRPLLAFRTIFDFNAARRLTTARRP